MKLGILMLPSVLFSSLVFAQTETPVAVSPAREIRLFHDYGSVNLGESKFVHWNLRAKQDKDLNIQNISMSGDGYTLQTDCPTVLPASQRCSVGAVFAPTTEGTFSGKLVVDLYGELFILELQGKGVTP